MVQTTSRKRPQKSISLHSSVLKKVEDIAEKENRQFSEVVERCLEEYFLMKGI